MIFLFTQIIIIQSIMDGFSSIQVQYCNKILNRCKRKSTFPIPDFQDVKPESDTVAIYVQSNFSHQILN